MLSNKLTFSLITSLVVLLAFGLAFVPSIADAAEWWQYQPEVSLSVSDVSNAPGNQVEAYAAGSFTGTPPVFTLGAAQDFMFYLKVTKGQASASTTINGGSTVANAVGDQLDISDLRFTLLDEDGVIISEPDPEATTVGAYIGLLANSTTTVITPVHGDDLGTNFRVTITAADFSTGDNAAAVLVHLPANSFRNTEPAAVAASLVDAEARPTGKNKKAPDHNLPIILVPQEPAAGDPNVVSTVRIVSTATRATSRFQQAQVTGPFQIRITLTEEGHNFAAADGTKSDFISVVNGTLTEIVPGVPFPASTSPQTPPTEEGNYSSTNPPATPPVPSGRDQMYHPYLLTIEPDLKIRDNAHENRVRNVEIRVKKFDDLVIPANSWVPPANYSLAVNRSLLEVPINPAAIKDIFEAAGKDKPANEKFIDGGLVIPAGGYLILAQGKAEHNGISASPAKLEDKKLPAQKLYNVKHEFGLPSPGNDLEAFFRAGGTIRLSHADVAANTAATGADANENGYLISNTAYTAGSVVISEIMWGRDASLGAADATKSQWIELHNPGTTDISIDKSEWTLSFYLGNPGPAGADVIDEVSNVGPPFWVAPGRSGATEAQRRVDVIDTTKADKPIVGGVFENFVQSTIASMYRKIDGANVMSGTSPDSWMASTTAGTRNLSGLRAGTPGAATPYTPPAPAPEPEPIPPTPVPPATAGDLSITEIMVASSSGRLPQWIEITNTSVGEVSLDGWMVGIDNDSADTDVVAASLSIKLDGVTLDAGQSALVVSKSSNRNSGVAARSKGDDNAGALDSNRIVDASSQVKPASMTYSMLSEMSFRISLEPPLPLAGGVTVRGDVVGNLGGAWELPMSEDGRSSIVRREMGTATEIMGTDAAGWVLADTTGLSGAYVGTYYGDKDDVGTPGYDAGGALPVELSKFSAARDRVTGQVVITWETQSELNNAGFYIKRSQQRTSKFVAVNPTMVPGAGTTSEKQTYTYTDTTAQPNIVYYYQIEDVSLDGNRQTLTRAHRLRGHIGAAGKATTTWGELKSSHQ